MGCASAALGSWGGGRLDIQTCKNFFAPARTYFIEGIFVEVWRQRIGGYPRDSLGVPQLLRLQRPIGIPPVHRLPEGPVPHPGVVGGRVEDDVLVTPHHDVYVLVRILVG